MAIPDVESGDTVSVVAPGDARVGSAITATPLMKTALFEVIRLVVPAGKETSNHTAPGDVTVQCLEGAVDVTAGGRTQRLAAGQLLYLAAGTLHSLHGVEDAAVLVTVVRCESGGRDAG
jgi:quercetin dioxygenase-like cupin family protein